MIVRRIIGVYRPMSKPLIKVFFSRVSAENKYSIQVGNYVYESKYYKRYICGLDYDEYVARRGAGEGADQTWTFNCYSSNNQLILGFDRATKRSQVKGILKGVRVFL